MVKTKHILFGCDVIFYRNVYSAKSIVSKLISKQNFVIVVIKLFFRKLNKYSVLCKLE